VSGVNGYGFFGLTDATGEQVKSGQGLVASVRGDGHAINAVHRALEVVADNGELSTP
jgi:hypothetical protein